jgi:hypothetical protein
VPPDSSRLAPRASDSSSAPSRAYARVPPSSTEAHDRAAPADQGLSAAYGQAHVMVCTGMIM